MLQCLKTAWIWKLVVNFSVTFKLVKANYLKCVGCALLCKWWKQSHFKHGEKWEGQGGKCPGGGRVAMLPAPHQCSPLPQRSGSLWEETSTKAASQSNKVHSEGPVHPFLGMDGPCIPVLGHSESDLTWQVCRVGSPLPGGLSGALWLHWAAEKSTYKKSTE